MSNERPRGVDRREFLRRIGRGVGQSALASLLLRDGLSFDGVCSPAPGRAKRAIWLCMAGAPSQLDMFDYKPGLAERFDQDLPESVRKGQRLTTMTSKQQRFPLAPSVFKFEKRDNGGDGAWVSELLPHLGRITDRLAIVRSLHTDAINHDPAITYLLTGRELPGWPSVGAWLSYGLGSMNENLPTFVVLNSSWTGRQDAQALYSRLWGAGVLPSRHQGVALRSKGDPVLFLDNPSGLSRALRRDQLDVLARMNRRASERMADPEIETRIAQYEMAFAMQASVPELVDVKGETAETLKLYGPDAKKPGTFAANCLLARRMMERGVRFVQIFHRGWDQHFNVTGDLPKQCRDIDQPSAALILDLERRGLLDDTLVIWSGEFGRTVYCQGELTRKNYGRDHHPRCFTGWLAGGGIRPGVVHGETDDFGYNIVKDPVHVRDLHATLLHCLGLDPETLAVKSQGLDVRLIGVREPARVVKELLL
ncbi:MAG TPA: DUF1501 domain-containing protein [Planctomycetes bacterium]|nr:DUF1501 domain-containing protein [Planctomycetota bacterium]